MATRVFAPATAPIVAPVAARTDGSPGATVAAGSADPLDQEDIATTTTVTGSWKTGFTVTVTTANGSTVKNGIGSAELFFDCTAPDEYKPPWGTYLFSVRKDLVNNTCFFSAAELATAASNAHVSLSPGGHNLHALSYFGLVSVNHYLPSVRNYEFNIVPSLAAPAMTAPANSVNVGDIVFKWTRVAGANDYSLRIRDMSRNKDIPLDVGNKQSVSHHLPAGEYRVWAKAATIDNDGNVTAESAFGTSRTFTVFPWQVNVTVPKAPAPAAQGLQIRWKETGGNPQGGDVDHYEVQVFDRTKGATKPVKYRVVPDYSISTQAWDFPFTFHHAGHVYGIYVIGCGPPAAKGVKMVRGPASKYREFTLTLDRPEMTAAAAGSNRIRITWKKLRPWEDVEDYAIVLCDPNTGKNIQQVIVPANGKDQQRGTITPKKATAGHKYLVSIRALGPNPVKGISRVLGLWTTFVSVQL